MTRLIFSLALATLLSLSVVAQADAGEKRPGQATKGHVSISPFVITKKIDKSSPTLT